MQMHMHIPCFIEKHADILCVRGTKHTMGVGLAEACDSLRMRILSIIELKVTEK